MKRAALLLSFVAACAVGDYAQGVMPCSVDEDCGVELVCALGTCADPDDPRLGAVDLAIAPPDSSGLVVQHVLAVRASGTGRVDVQLRPTIRVQGHVHSSTGAGAAALVVAAADETIPGKSLSVVATSDPADGAFSLALVEGQRYALKVYPNDTALPPLYVDDALTAQAPSGTIQLDAIALPDPETLVVVTGVVMAGADTSALAIPDLAVSLAENGVSVSATARTDADGHFALAVSPGHVGPLTLAVAPTPENALFPTVVVDVPDAASSIDLGIVDLGDFAGPVAFEGHVLDPADAPVAAAAVHLFGAIGAGLFATVVEADEEGTFHAQLPPGTYEVSVVPPASSAAGALVGTTVLVDPTMPNATLRVPARVQTSGNVFDASGEAVVGAVVSVAHVDCAGVTAEPSLFGSSWSFEAVTDDDGRYIANVDPGCYSLAVTPAYGSGLPRHARAIQVAEAGSILDVTLDPAALFAGAVVDPDGQPVPGAIVQAFSRLPTTDGTAFALGDGIAGGDGGFSIVIPDLLTAPSSN